MPSAASMTAIVIRSRGSRTAIWNFFERWMDDRPPFPRGMMAQCRLTRMTMYTDPIRFCVNSRSSI